MIAIHGVAAIATMDRQLSGPRSAHGIPYAWFPTRSSLAFQRWPSTAKRGRDLEYSHDYVGIEHLLFDHALTPLGHLSGPLHVGDG
jgi:hypothetical protein